MKLNNHRKCFIKTALNMFLLFMIVLSPITKAMAQADNSINKFTTAYLDVKNALVTDDGKLAEDKAKVLLAALSDKPGQGLNTNQQKILATYIDKLKFDSRHMSETTVIDHQREHFTSLSKNMYMLLKAINANTATLYVQYCPMKKSYWVSETESIKNPYYGKQMTDCGATKAILKPAGK